MVHGGRRKHEHRLAFCDLIHTPVPILAARFSAEPWVPEVVCLIDDDDVGLFLDPRESLRILACPEQVGVTEHDKAAEVTSEIRKVPPQLLSPHRLSRRFRHEERDALAVVHDKALDQHETHEGFPESDAIAEESPAEL